MQRRGGGTVPLIRDVFPGAVVNVVLKADQPTGRTVSGVVQELLTRGDHPRGIKVRLSDGRVGRVQSMADSAAADAVAPSSSTPEQAAQPTRRQGRGSKARDEGLEMPTQQYGLDAFIKPSKKDRQARRNDRSGTAVDLGSDTVDAAKPAVEGSVTTLCPVCEIFEGDETAIAHHVASHFEDEDG